LERSSPQREQVVAIFSEGRRSMNTNTPGLVFIAAVLLIVGLAGCSGEIRPPTVPDYSASDLEAQTAADNQRALDALLNDFPDAEVPDVDQVRLWLSPVEWWTFGS
jgi:hypothetical protein